VQQRAVVRAGLRLMIDRAPGLTVVGEAATGGDAIRPSPLLATLTDREREVVSLVADGMFNADIARQLTLSPLTVKTHANHAMTKLGARDRAQLVVLAYQSGLSGGVPKRRISG
jgi:DNA-binding NarL/FixJ family response regulator